MVSPILDSMRVSSVFFFSFFFFLFLFYLEAVLKFSCVGHDGNQRRTTAYRHT